MSSTTPSRSDSATLRGLQRLLGSVDKQTFVDEFLGARMLHVRGESDRWSDLFGWDDLNTALNAGLVSHPRARLMIRGPEVPTSAYTYERSGRQWLDSHRCQQLMAEGATLVLMNVESLVPRLHAFVRDLERDFRGPVRVDVVATTASVPGLPIHWDNSECFNIQLDGEKTWEVVAPERVAPLTATFHFPERKDTTKPVPPTTPPTWSGTMQPGDLICLPRGWWHTVTPRVSPSLHLSLAAEIPTLTDYLRWLAVEATRLETARRPIPIWRNADERGPFTSEALRELRDLISPASLEDYLTHLSDETPAPLEFALPRAAVPGGIAPDGHTVLRLRSARPLVWTQAGGAVTFTWRGQLFRFDERVLPALRLLNETGTTTLDDLRRHLDGLTAQVLVFTLLKAELLAVSVR